VATDAGDAAVAAPLAPDERIADLISRRYREAAFTAARSA